jgi:anti-sigma factor RsiW
MSDRIHAYVDGALPPGEREAYEAHLRENPAEAQAARAFTEQRTRLHLAYDPVLAEPIPAGMHLSRPRWLDLARAAGILAVGVALGMGLQALRTPVAPAAPLVASVALPERAARAHAVFVSEVRHPVEVDASQQDHLVKWLSKRLGTELKVPVLTPQGYELLGGRLLPGPDGPVAQFMFQEASGKRLTLYVTARSKADGPTAFRFAREGNVSVFYWIDGSWGYALSGDVDKAALSRVADVVYRQLNP